MKQNHRLLIVIIFFSVLFSFFLFSFFSKKENKQNNQKFNFISEKNLYISPHEKIIIGFTDDPKKFSCVIKKTNLPEEIVFSTSYKENSIIVSSRFTWPEGTLLTFSISCDNFSGDISFIIKDQKRLTEEEWFAVEVKNQVETSHQRQEYLQSHPYIQNFPIVRDNYMILFLEKEHVMYVSAKEGKFTEEEEEEIKNNERPYVKTIGVPDSVPFVFSL